MFEILFWSSSNSFFFLLLDFEEFFINSNSFSSSYPIVNSNIEFSSVIPVNSLSNIEFRLVDANMHDVKLLTPMYISLQTDSIDQQESKPIST